MLPVVTRTVAEIKLEKNQSQWIRRAKLSVANTCKTIRLAFASPLHLLSLSFATKQMTLIHNHLCLLNGQIDIPEV